MNGIMLHNEPYQIINDGHTSSHGMQTKVWLAKASKGAHTHVYYTHTHIHEYSHILRCIESYLSEAICKMFISLSTHSKPTERP